MGMKLLQKLNSLVSKTQDSRGKPKPMSSSKMGQTVIRCAHSKAFLTFQ